MDRLNTRNLLKRKKSRLKERIALVPNHKLETRVLAQIACSSTRLGSDKFVMSQANIFARFVNELARANSQAAHEPNELESKRSNIESRDIKTKPRLNLHDEYKYPPYTVKFKKQIRPPGPFLRISNSRCCNKLRDFSFCSWTD
jgi:hypothetical protein